MAVFFRRGVARKVALVAGPVLMGVSVSLLTAGTAHGAELSCGGQPPMEDVLVDGTSACGVRTDATSNAFAHALDAVAFARAEVGGSAVGLAQGGAVAAAETASGQVGALAFGRNAVSIVSPDPGAVAVAISLAPGQTSVGTASEGVRCDAGAGLALNLTTGQSCLSDGATTWRSGVTSPR